jgi:ABC-type Mn2+/Zn2+ transport system ATPase subunit
LIQLLSIGLSVSYPDKANVLHDISLNIQRREILGLVGQNRSGKSTLALAILVSPSGMVETPRLQAKQDFV